MTTIWRLQTRTDNKTNKEVSALCIEKSVLAMGWSANDEHIDKNLRKSEIQAARLNIQEWEQYESLIREYGVYDGKIGGSVRCLYQDVKENDLVWVRKGGHYYLGRVLAGSQWQYDADEAVLMMDASNQRSNIEWHEVGDEADVPGAVATSFIQGRTIQRIHAKGIKEYSMLLYNELCKKEHYSGVKITTSKGDSKLKVETRVFYSLLSTDDCEDLLCAWLYYKKGYITIPSTNKKSTPLYECVLKDPETGKSIYIQVKKGKDNLSARGYIHLKGEVYLLTTEGTVDMNGANKKIVEVDPEELYDAVKNGVLDNVLPDSIRHWRKYMESHMDKTI